MAHDLGRRPIILSAVCTSSSSNQANDFAIPYSYYVDSTTHVSFDLLAKSDSIVLQVKRGLNYANNGWFTSGSVTVYYW